MLKYNLFIFYFLSYPNKCGVPVKFQRSLNKEKCPESCCSHITCLMQAYFYHFNHYKLQVSIYKGKTLMPFLFPVASLLSIKSTTENLKDKLSLLLNIFYQCDNLYLIDNFQHSLQRQFHLVSVKNANENNSSIP